jgi:hypothetical protein
MFIETWTPVTGNWEVDVDKDAIWLAASIENLRKLVMGIDADAERSSGS